MKKTKTMLMLAAFFCVASGIYAGARADMAAEMQQEPNDPKKKKPGDECKSADECQRHHSCEKVGDKNVCKAPAPHKLPPGVVT